MNTLREIANTLLWGCILYLMLMGALGDFKCYYLNSITVACTLYVGAW